MHWLKIGLLVLFTFSVSKQSQAFSLNFGDLKFGGCERLNNHKITGSADELLAKAQTYIDKEDFCRATKHYVVFVTRNPSDSRARDIRLKSIRTAFKATYYNDTLLLADEYLELFPNGSEAEEVNLLKVKARFKMIIGPHHSQDPTDSAIIEILKFKDSFPSSTHMDEVKTMLQSAVDVRSAHHLDVGMQYLKQKKYRGSLGRCHQIFEKYQSSSHMPQALYCMAKSYANLDLPEEAQTAVVILERNFPESKWLEKSRKALKNK